MIDLALPWILLALPLPLLAWWLLPPAERQEGGALRVPFFAALSRISSGHEGKAGPQRLTLALKSLAWGLLVLAAAQPRFVGEAQTITTHGRDLMLALDISGSMGTRDFDVQGRPVDRLRVVNAVAREFVRNREGDRVGLILFGSRAYLQAPLTFDRETVVEMLDEAELGLAGKETAIGDAIGLAVKHLRELPTEERVLILLSDGASNSGVLEPIRAAEIAAQENVRIYTIGIGSDGPAFSTAFGTIRAGGNPDLDERTLQLVAQKTEGNYFRARDTQSLLDVYAQINALETTEGEAATVRPTRALFYWPLAAALALCLAVPLGRCLREATLFRRTRFPDPTERRVQA